MIDSGASLLGLRAMYLVAVIGAGVVGIVTLFAPRVAGEYVFVGATDVNVYLRILGALWLALGVAALCGLYQPLKFSPVLLIQLVYKAAWLLAAAVPALLSGNREPGLLFMAGLFAVWVVALLFVVPFRHLLGA